MTHTQTLDESPAHAAPPRADHLYLIVGGGRAGGGARWSLADVDVVEVGRGSARASRRSGRTLRLDGDDAWMSSVHARFTREVGHWTIADAGSRNGVLVDGVRQARAVVRPGAIIEIGRSFFTVQTDELAAPDRALADAPPGALVTLDPELGARFEELARVAPTRLPVVIGGPTGSGKERVARALHAQSGRRGPFVAVNCGALPAGLVEGALFGHRRGAFSGAIADQVGLVVASDGGTLFLDEIGDLPAPAQAALLRVLEAREVMPIGAVSPTPVDLRVVAASHHHLDERVARGAFREDLYARLAGFELELPALAERRVDLGAMLAEIAPGLAASAGWFRAALAYAWPRNVRELVQAVERARALAGTAELEPRHWPPEVAGAALATTPAADPASSAQVEQLRALLIKHRGNVTRIADELGQVRQQVQRALKRFDLDPSRYRT